MTRVHSVFLWFLESFPTCGWKQLYVWFKKITQMIKRRNCIWYLMMTLACNFITPRIYSTSCARCSYICRSSFLNTMALNMLWWVNRIWSFVLLFGVWFQELSKSFLKLCEVSSFSSFFCFKINDCCCTFRSLHWA